MQSKILIIEDDHAITHLLDVALTLDYYNVTQPKMPHKHTLKFKLINQMSFY